MRVEIGFLHAGYRSLFKLAKALEYRFFGIAKRPLSVAVWP
jgi:hypothetical protein